MWRRAAIGLLLFGAAAGLQAADSPRVPGTTFRDCDTCPEMVVVPAGSFVMGAAAAPGTVVIQIPRAFALGLNEVTRGEYARFIAASGHEPRPGCRNWDPAL